MTERIRKNHFIWLTLALVALIVIGGISRGLPDNIAVWLLRGSAVGLFMLSLFSFLGERILLKRFLAIIALMVLAAVAADIAGGFLLDLAFIVLLMVFLLVAAWLVARQVLLTGSVSFNKIIGSIALFLLVGLIYSALYTILLQFSPGAISGIEADPWFDVLPVTNYFSIVTLTSLGYGDLHPVSPMARVIAMLEVVTGLFYMAIVVASLIGAFLRQEEGERG